jgi:hypothetical protein
MTKNEALTKLFNQSETFGFNYYTWHSYKRRYFQGKLSEKTINLILCKCGAVKIEDEKWSFDKSK